MTPDNFEGIEEPRKTWCKERMIGARDWVKSYGRDTLEVQLEAALERMVGLESLLNEPPVFKCKPEDFMKVLKEINMTPGCINVISPGDPYTSEPSHPRYNPYEGDTITVASNSGSGAVATVNVTDGKITNMFTGEEVHPTRESDDK